MPLYDYQCIGCGGRDQRLSGLDDDLAICQALVRMPGRLNTYQTCGGMMLRVDQDAFQPYSGGDLAREGAEP